MNHLLDARRVLVAMVALGLFALAARSVTDPDLWWHLRTGQLILRNHAVFHSDPYSFTRLGQPWVNHEWLSDVFLFAVYRVSGWGGLDCRLLGHHRRRFPLGISALSGTSLDRRGRHDLGRGGFDTPVGGAAAAAFPPAHQRVSAHP